MFERLAGSELALKDAAPLLVELEVNEFGRVTRYPGICNAEFVA